MQGLVREESRGPGVKGEASHRQRKPEGSAREGEQRGCSLEHRSEGQQGSGLMATCSKHTVEC